MTNYQPHLRRIAAVSSETIETLVRWAHISSGSRNPAGLDKMLVELEAAFAPLGGEMRRLELKPRLSVNNSGVAAEEPLGRALHIRKRPESDLRVLLSIHMDTVYGPDHPFRRCTRSDRGTLIGPGTADAKGGILVMLRALEALEGSPWADAVGWEVLLTPDEELGSPGSAELLEAAAERNHLGLVFEPALPDGSLVRRRKGSGNFAVVTRGRSAHAGRDPHSGRNAISALARFIVRLDDTHAGVPGVTVNTGYVSGGGPVNVVPDLALARVNIRVESAADQELVESNLRNLKEETNRLDGLTLELHGGFARPPKPLDEKTADLLELFRKCGAEIGLTIGLRDSGGASDGNNLAAAGLPTVDSLGPQGGNLHSSEEYVLPDSLTERAALTALALMKIASGAASLDFLPSSSPKSEP